MTSTPPSRLSKERAPGFLFAGVAHRPLTNRERDCLRQLELGRSTAETATALGLSRSTLNTHLASARHKLGVRNTTQALLILAKQRASDRRSNFDADRGDGPLNERQITLVDQLARCDCFADAWLALHEYAAALGIKAINFWIVADPELVLDEHSCAMWSSLPDEFLQQYRELGGMPTDPSGPRIVSATEPLIIDAELYVDTFKAMPAAIRAIGMAAIDAHLNRMLYVSQRDSVTAAANGLVFSFDLRQYREFERVVSAARAELVQTTAIFWDHVQRARLMADELGLSPRERQALVLVARGCSLLELAEQMGVSLRAGEKFLAGARAKLGARTNAQAVYRALVYRAFT